MRQQSMSDPFWNKKPFNAETTKIISPNTSLTNQFLKVNKDLSIPIIAKVQNENIHFRQQKQKIAKQLQKLDALSLGLLAENQRLRSHYYHRNQDVQNIIQTIKMNIGVQTNDIQHQIHLLREGNCLAFRAIQTQRKRTEEYQQRINQLTKKFLHLKDSAVDLQEKVLNPLNVRAKNRLNKKFIQKLSEKQQQYNKIQKKLWEEVTSLAFEVNSLQKQNIQVTRQTSDQNNQNNTNKHQYKISIIQSLKSITQLKAENQDLTQLQAKSMRIKTQLEANLKEVDDRQRALYVQKQKKLAKLNKLMFERQRQLQSLNGTRVNISELDLEMMKRSDQREKMINQVKSKRKQIEKLEQKLKGQKIAVEAAAFENIQKAKAKIERAEIQFKQEQEQVKKQIQFDRKVIETLEDEFNQLNKDQQDYFKMQSKLHNPVLEIERAQLAIRIRSNSRQGLRPISTNI